MTPSFIRSQAFSRSVHTVRDMDESESGSPTTTGVRSALRTPPQPTNSARGAGPILQSGVPPVSSTSRETTPTLSDQASSRATSRQPSIGPHSQYSRTFTPPSSSPPPSSRATSRQPSIAADMPSPSRHREPLPHLDDFVPRRRPITRSISRGSLRFESLSGEDKGGQGLVVSFFL